jgi:hypothetical protein
LWLIIHAISSEGRKIAVISWIDFLSRLIFSIIIQLVILRGNSPITYSGALISLKLLDDRKWFLDTMYLIRIFRFIYNGTLSCVIPYYIYTVDENGEEGSIDLVQNFTALYIMCDIDQLLAYDNNYIEKWKELLEKIRVENLITIYKKDIKKTCASQAIDIFGHIIFVSSMPVLIFVATII